MRWLAATLALFSSCALPSVELVDSLGDGGAAGASSKGGTSSSGGSGGSAGSATGGKSGKGGSGGSGDAASAGEAGAEPGGSSGSGGSGGQSGGSSGSGGSAGMGAFCEDPAFTVPPELCEDFEPTVDQGLWIEAFEESSDVGHNGTNAGLLISPSQFAYFIEAPPMDGRIVSFWAHVPQPFQGPEPQLLITYFDGSSFFGFGFCDTSPCWYSPANGGSSYTVGLPFDLDVWYCYEIRVNPPEGEVTASVYDENGALVGDVTPGFGWTNWAPPIDFSLRSVGFESNPGGAGDIYLDDILISELDSACAQ